MQIIEFDYFFTPDGLQYNLNDWRNKFAWAISGQGLPGVEYTTQRAPFQDGVTVLDYRLGTRAIQMIHRHDTCSRQEYWDARTDFLNFIRPNRNESAGLFQTGCLRKILPDGSIRDINVTIDQGPLYQGAGGKWDEYAFEEAIRFIAHDPLFFNPNKIIYDLTLPAAPAELSFPIIFPIEFSSDGSVPTDTLTYNGNYRAYPEIILHGALREPIINNITIGSRIKLETTIPTDRTVTISLQPGAKSIVDDLGTNYIGFLSSDSDLSNFFIAPDPLAPSGVNLIGFAAGLTDANSRVVISWFERYIGI